MLKVCSSATGEDLTTRANLKDELGLTDNADDAILDRLITRASAWAADRLGTYPFRQVYRETVAAYGRRHLMLSRHPIRNVTSVYSGTDTGTATEVKSTEYRRADDEAGLLSRDQGWAWTARSADQLSAIPLPGMEEHRYLVDYEAGWTFGTTSTLGGTTSTGRTLPQAIEQAVLLKARSWYLRRKGDPSVKSQSIGDLSITYRDEGGQMDDEAEALLGPYRRLR